ncbi:hypothetical protein RHEC894_PC00256 (plasmid) [Rhizobium sp. CIAT894]|uniref:Uncharacterized protein n=1 Tax=Rhizobium etli (strain CIAT 652) TaxID=491916 RepID=B3Q2K9_RHIE6|nr:hypothetical protein RHECIAT_PB0000204 [Rhizobium etli CIAT 652]ARM14918.1 hypothetical protein Bra5_PB00168 [Rhizobium phaseoli Brasil 5]ARM91288.1 hypothetical protein RHEC894_PC00256 [Rhizobium sp. CIAT894]EJZ17188.1 hypothetical protein RCCGEPOP_32126 [Rhizobium sp. Pop5]KKZ84710.1 hypothetical protein RPHASCH2410_PC01960 [Rhizobium phaseoli Ch24-10]
MDFKSRQGSCACSWLRGVTRKIKTRGALRYSISRRDIFERFLKDGRVEVDSTC